MTNPAVRLTQRQRRCMAAIAEGGEPSTLQVASRVNYSLTREEREARVWENDALTPCRQLAAKGLIVECGVKYGPKTWSLTTAGVDLVLR